MGGVKCDEVQFNEKTLWRGHVGSIVDNGSYGSYLDFGHLFITDLDPSLQAVTNYRRWLDIDEALAGVAYDADGVSYEREYFVSYPDRVLAIRYKASEAGKIHKNLILYNANGAAPEYSTAADGVGQAVFSGEAVRTGTSQNEAFYCQMKVVAKGGTVVVNPAGGLDVAGADEMVVYLLGATNFSPDNDNYIYPAAELPGKVQPLVEAAVSQDYEHLRSVHIADYRSLYDRCQLSISRQQNSVTTPTLISNFARNSAKNLLLEELYFAYGRYLMIACSRGVDLPSNLQGIWNNSNSPAWNSDIHSNINVQMNYWPAEATNLSELHLPFLNYIKREACDRSQWRKNASQIAGQTKGWTLTTENNIYGSGSNWMKNYTIANAWYCMHLWQHYRYTLDTDYLWQTALPAMRSCCEYWLQRLKLAKDGTYECPNEYSPEHGPGSENATAHSQQLVWDLFNNTLQAYDEYGRRTGKDFMTAELETFLAELRTKFGKLDPGTATEVVGGKTLLREWKYTSQSTVSSYNSHRHLSHLIGLYPGNQIAEVITQSLIPKIIEERYPELTPEEQEQLRQHLVLSTTLQGAEVVTHEDGSKFLRVAGQFINLDDLSINLIDSINPFQRAYEILSKSLTPEILRTIQDTIDSQREEMTKEEAILLYKKYLPKYKEEHGGALPTVHDPDPTAKRIAVAIAFLRKLKQQSLTAK